MEVDNEEKKLEDGIGTTAGQSHSGKKVFLHGLRPRKRKRYAKPEGRESRRVLHLH